MYFYFLFCFSIYKIVDIEHSTDNHKFSKISIGAISNNEKSRNIKICSDHLKTKKKCKHAIKKLSFVLRYVPDRYKTQHMCNKVILENGATLEFVPNCYRNQQMSGN